MSQKVGLMGVEFVDVTKVTEGAMRVEEWSSTAPKWRQAAPGLCVEGECTTKGCDAYGRSVIVNWGIGKEFSLGRDSHLLKCPICERHVKPATCAFNRCDWNYRGKLWTDYTEPEEKVNPEKARQAGNAYHVFDKNVTARWNKLKIVTASEGTWCTESGRVG